MGSWIVLYPAAQCDLSRVRNILARRHEALYMARRKTRQGAPGHRGGARNLWSTIPMYWAAFSIGGDPIHKSLQLLVDPVTHRDVRKSTT